MNLVKFGSANIYILGGPDVFLIGLQCFEQVICSIPLEMTCRFDMGPESWESYDGC